MPFCPECKVEYREGFTTCSDCYVELVAELPSEESEAQEREDLTNEPLAEVFVAENGMEAEIVLGILESAGIRGYLTPDVSPYAMRLRPSVDRMYQQSIYVLESRAEEAASIIQQALASGTETETSEES